MCNETRTNCGCTFSENHVELHTDTLCNTLVIIASMGLVGNLLALFTITNKKLKNKSFSVYVRSLALCDTVVLVLTVGEHLLGWIYGQELTIVIGIPGQLSFHFFGQFSQMLSSWILVAISVDRFIVVVYPLRRFTMCTSKRARWTCAGIAAFSAILISAEVLIPAFEMDPCEIHFSKGSQFDLMTRKRRLIGTLLIPGTIALILNIKIMTVIRRMINVRRNLSACPCAQAPARPSQLNITLALAIVTVLSAILFIPVIILDAIDHMQASNDGFLLNENQEDHFISRWCASEMIYVLDISLHFYTLILISFGYNYGFLDAVILLENKLIETLTPSASPSLSTKSYNVQSKATDNNITTNAFVENNKLTVTHM